MSKTPCWSAKQFDLLPGELVQIRYDDQFSFVSAQKQSEHFQLAKAKLLLLVQKATTSGFSSCAPTSAARKANKSHNWLVVSEVFDQIGKTWNRTT